MAEDSKRAQDELMAKLQAMLVDAETRGMSAFGGEADNIGSV